jgi:hypothetical protein
MPAVVNVNATGRREFLMDRLFKVDNRMCTFTSMARKPKGGNSESTGIPNSVIGSYQAKVLGDIKAGGRADGKDVTAFDSNPPREQISFRPEFFYRAPMVGTLAKDDVIAGLENGGEWADAVGDQMILHKRDMEKQFLSALDSSANGGREGGTVTRGLEKWISASASDFSELVPPSGARTPSNQIFTGAIGTIDSGLTEDAAKAILKARWDNTGDSGELVGFLGTYIKERFSLFKEYKPTLSNATVVVRTNTEAYTSKEIRNASVDVFNTEWGSFSLIPVNTIFLTDAYTGLFVDMAQIEIRSRFWMREKPLPDLGGGPREEISSFVALIPGDLRSHAKIDATA